MHLGAQESLLKGVNTCKMARIVIPPNNVTSFTLHNTIISHVVAMHIASLNAYQPNAGLRAGYNSAPFKLFCRVYDNMELRINKPQYMS